MKQQIKDKAPILQMFFYSSLQKVQNQFIKGRPKNIAPIEWVQLQVQLSLNIQIRCDEGIITCQHSRLLLHRTSRHKQ